MSYVLFFLTIGRHQRSTLFPYTTLFRSQVLEQRADGVEAEPLGGGRRLGRRHGQRRGEPRRPRVARRDRKSTRLNSSHGYISYAVFCLKKKKSTTSQFRK